MVRGEHSLKISVPQLLWFSIDSALKIFPQNMTELMNELMNDEAVCRTAPATPGLLKNCNVQTYKPEAMTDSMHRQMRCLKIM